MVGAPLPPGLRRLIGAIGLGSLVVVAWEGALSPASAPVHLASGRLEVPALDVEPAPEPPPPTPLPELRLVGLAEGSRLTVTPFGAEGEPLDGAFHALEAFFAPKSAALPRSGNSAVSEPPAPIDPRLVGVLMELSRAFDDRPITLVSGHREPGRGTRASSYHVKGMAADIAIEGVRPFDVYQKALELGARGTGLYRHFVHVDVRDAPRYRWGGGGPRIRLGAPARSAGLRAR